MTRKASKLNILGQATPVVERKDAARNRLRILEAARNLLETRPIQAICMDELARSAGVGKGTLYRRFEDRASLCRALLHEDAKLLQDRVLAEFGLSPQTPYLVRLTYLVEALFDFAVDHASLLSEARAYERGLSRFDHPAHAWQRQAIVRYLERAIAAGEMNLVDPMVTAESILAALDPDLLQWHLAHRTRESLRKTLVSLWLGALSRRTDLA